ncbi:MAG: NAD(P)/FAD-dependent oxidoreductase [Burkholderiaceae bacterium]|nr:NAD(P)/FAD-dependent oxidoreductase [Burkholderiaceae bacterium]
MIDIAVSKARRREVLDCVIVGAGPAGLTAALYLRRFHRNVRIIDAGASRAGRIPRANNIAGFPDGIAGTQLLQRMNRHLRQVDGYVVHGTVVRIEQGPDDLFAVSLADQQLWTRNVILCTGVVDRRPALPGFEDVAIAGLVRACPVCDGYELTGKCIGVIGDSMQGEREAAFLQHFSQDVRLIRIAGAHCELDVDSAAEARVHRLPGAAQHVAVSKDRKVFVTMDDGSGHRFDVLYTALGVDPCTQLVAALGARLDERGNLVTDSHCRTNVSNLYAAGDVVSALDQISVAVGHAAIAATTVHNSLLPKTA